MIDKTIILLLAIAGVTIIYLVVELAKSFEVEAEASKEEAYIEYLEEKVEDLLQILERYEKIIEQYEGYVDKSSR